MADGLGLGLQSFGRQGSGVAGFGLGLGAGARRLSASPLLSAALARGGLLA